MKYTKILSLLAAASMAVSPASMTVYAEGDNTNDKPAQTEQNNVRLSGWWWLKNKNRIKYLLSTKILE